MWLAQAFVRARLKRRGVQEPGYLMHMDERFGHYDARAPELGKYVWIHAVSLGETRAAAVLIDAMRLRGPALHLLLTHGTATGREAGLALLRTGDVQVWQPWDTPQAVARFLKHFSPRIGILMETEVWPNLVAGCAQMKVPLVLANARMSSKSLKTSLKLSWLARPAYQALSAAWAQTQADADRLVQLGAPVKGVFGNVKFDATPNAELLARGRQWRNDLHRLVVMLAISREGEEAQLLDLLRKDFLNATATSIATPASRIQWLIVPRHPQRFEEVAGLIQARGFKLSRRSSWAQGPAAFNGDLTQPVAQVWPTIWLGDSLGEMPLYYGLADAALLGGSFENLGGQNLIEAAACGCPVVMGPHTFNFAEAASLANAAGAAQRAPSMARAVVAVCEIVLDAASLQASRHNALAFAQAHRGAADRLALAIDETLQLLHK